MFDREFPSLWPVLFIIFVGLQIMRVWVIASLGRFWNTKILVLPGAHVVKKGPFRFLRHPNYVVVSLEILVIPLMFGAYFTALIFALLNLIILSVRIPDGRGSFTGSDELQGSLLIDDFQSKKADSNDESAFYISNLFFKHNLSGNDCFHDFCFKNLFIWSVK